MIKRWREKKKVLELARLLAEVALLQVHVEEIGENPDILRPQRA